MHESRLRESERPGSTGGQWGAAEGWPYLTRDGPGKVSVDCSGERAPPASEAEQER